MICFICLCYRLYSNLISSIISNAVQKCEMVEKKVAVSDFIFALVFFSAIQKFLLHTHIKKMCQVENLSMNSQNTYTMIMCIKFTMSQHRMLSAASLNHKTELNRMKSNGVGAILAFCIVFDVPPFLRSAFNWN